MATALITGASGGIGLELTKLLATDGYDLILVARSGNKLDALAHEMSGVRTRVIVADLATAAGADQVLELVAAGGRDVDLLVNNAGAGLHGPFVRSAIERELAMVQLNIGSLLQLTKRLLPGMIARGRGHIVNIASVAAYVPGPNQSVYYATKVFVRSFSDSLAAELRGTGFWRIRATWPRPSRGRSGAARRGWCPGGGIACCSE